MEGMCGGSHTYVDQHGEHGITGHDRTVNITRHGHNNTYTIHAQPKHQDPVLRFFDMCPAYDEYVAQTDADFLVRCFDYNGCNIGPLLEMFKTCIALSQPAIVDHEWFHLMQELSLPVSKH